MDYENGDVERLLDNEMIDATKGEPEPQADAKKEQKRHLLKASANYRRMIENIRPYLSEESTGKLEDEFNRNVVQLFRLGEEYFAFAKAVDSAMWRQKVSRFYYAAFFLSRAARLEDAGTYVTDVSDHKHIGDLPDGFVNIATYQNKLKALRDDRNLADYSHDASEGDLTTPTKEIEALVEAFMDHVRAHLKSRGIAL